MENKLAKIVNELIRINHKEYLNKFPLATIINEPIEFESVPLKWESVDKDNHTPLRAEIDDLVRLHFLIRFLKSRIVLEFGVGKSTKVMANALQKNEIDFAYKVTQELRVTNPFVVHSVDNSHLWLDKIKIDNINNLCTHYSPCEMGVFNGRICTYYKMLPNIRPDFIYLDAPSQYGVEGFIRGITTEHPDRMPMAGDLLAIEYFLEPGTFIVVDGRTANARFLEKNFQRNWEYLYVKEFDQHYFYLNEEPLGIWNEAALDFVGI
jgi:hypothetical protein